MLKFYAVRICSFLSQFFFAEFKFSSYVDGEVFSFCYKHTLKKKKSRVFFNIFISILKISYDQHLQEEVEILSQSNEKLRQETSSVETQLEDGLFEELEKNTALCQVIHFKETLQWIIFQCNSNRDMYSKIRTELQSPHFINEKIYHQFTDLSMSFNYWLIFNRINIYPYII